jgi:hypothetical protein
MLEDILSTLDLPEDLDSLPKNYVRIIKYFINGTGTPPQLRKESTYVDTDTSLTVLRVVDEQGIAWRTVYGTDIQLYAEGWTSILSYEVHPHRLRVGKGHNARTEFAPVDLVIAVRYEDSIVCNISRLWDYDSVARSFIAVLLHNGYTCGSQQGDHLVFMK